MGRTLKWATRFGITVTILLLSVLLVNRIASTNPTLNAARSIQSSYPYFQAGLGTGCPFGGNGYPAELWLLHVL